MIERTLDRLGPAADDTEGSSVGDNTDGDVMTERQACGRWAMSHHHHSGPTSSEQGVVTER